MKRKIISLFLVALMVSTCLIGCAGGGKGGFGSGNKGGSNSDAATIKIAYWNSGMGIDWLNAVVDGFEEKYPQYTVDVTASASKDAITATYGLPDIDETDLYFNVAMADNTYLESLEDVLDSTVEGESMTLREKFYEGYLSGNTSTDGKTYMLTYGGGVISFAYSKKMFEEARITQLPRTTDELVVVCDSLQSAGYTPLCHFKTKGYYHIMASAIQAQYDGQDYYLNNFYGCTDTKGKSPSLDVLTAKDGRYYALKVLEKIVTPDYTLSGSNSKSHTEVQTEFINGRCAMMLNGSWLVNEMKSSGADLGAFRVPVVSAIVNKLSTVKNDGDLRKVITAIDQVFDGEKQMSDFASGDNYVIGNLTVSKADWDIILAARGISATNYAGEVGYIPNYSDQKEGAKEFLKYLYSDEGIKLYNEATKCPLPIRLSTGEKYDTSKYSDFETAQFEILENSTFMAEYFNVQNQHKIFAFGGAEAYAGVNYISRFCTNNAADRMTADEVWDNIVKTMKDNYDGWLANIK